MTLCYQTSKTSNQPNIPNPIQNNDFSQPLSYTTKIVCYQTSKETTHRLASWCYGGNLQGGRQMKTITLLSRKLKDYKNVGFLMKDK
jgi:hypothetical protein